MSESDRSMGMTMPSLSFQPSSPLDMVCVAPHMAGGTAGHGTGDGSRAIKGDGKELLERGRGKSVIGKGEQRGRGESCRNG